MKIKFVQNITVNDPDYGNEVTLNIYKEDSGMLFAIENNFDIGFDDPIISPYGNGTLETDNEELRP